MQNIIKKKKRAVFAASAVVALLFPRDNASNRTFLCLHLTYMHE